MASLFERVDSKEGCALHVSPCHGTAMADGGGAAAVAADDDDGENGDGPRKRNI